MPAIPLLVPWLYGKMFRGATDIPESLLFYAPLALVPKEPLGKGFGQITGGAHSVCSAGASHLQLSSSFVALSFPSMGFWLFSF